MAKKQHSLRPHEQRALQNGTEAGTETAPKDERATAEARPPKHAQGKRGNGSKK